MNRKTSIISLLLLSALCMQAQERTDEQMQEIAKVTLSKAMAKAQDKTSIQQSKLKTIVEDSQYSLFAGQNGKGYVLVSRNEAFSPVIGYSDEPVALDEIPCCMQAFLDMINQNLEERLASGETNAPKKADVAFEVVSPLLKTYWGQGKPYNLLCPKDGDGKTTYTGCVATAMAMVMNYYKYPSSVDAQGFYTVKTNESQQIDVNIKSTYQWDQMLNTYTSSSGTEAQRNAVAQLMYDCGCAVGMNYGSTGSGGSVTTAAQKFHDVFKYAAVNHTNKNYYSDYEWYKLVYDQLKAGCPLIHSGTDKSTNSGHAFIFDGVDKNGMVHVNWGWGSSNHGYFDMLTLTPTNGSTQHNFSTGLGFIYNLKAKPALDEGEEQEYQLVVGRGTGDYKDDYYYICQEDNDIVLYTHGVFNWTPVPFKGYLGVRYENLDGGSNYNVRLKTPTGGYYVAIDVNSRVGKSFGGIEARHIQTPSAIKPGTYKVFFAGFNDDKSNLKYRCPVRLRYEGQVYWILTVDENGKLTLSDKKVVDSEESAYPTGVRTIWANDREQNGKTYNMNGQLVDDSYKGIVIVKGKKLIRK